MNKSIILSLTLLLSASILWSQQDLSTHFMRGTWQANQTNPALWPDKKVIIGLGGVYNNLFADNITYNDVIIDGSDGGKVLDIGAAIPQLEDENFIREDFSLETISVGLRFGKLSVSVGHAFRLRAYMNYPKTMAQVIWEGNAQFIGQEVAIGPDVQLTGYNELSFGAAYQVSDRLTIGGRAKLLGGFADVSVENDDLRLFTDDDVYQSTVNGGYRFSSAGSIQYDGFDDFELDFDFDRFDVGEIFGSNSGFAFDLGAHLDLGKLEISASALDIGGIDWEDDVTNYTVNEGEFNGLDIADDLLDENSETISLIDSLEEVFNFTETAEGYRTDLPQRYYLSATYQFNDMWRFGGLLYGESYRDEFFPAVAVSANAKVLSFLEVGAIYAFRSETFDNLGLNAAVNLGPVQLVAATDNILTAFDVLNSNSANFRVGVNLQFGSREPFDVNKISNQERFFDK